jgi:hypothetical protein
VYNDLDDVIDSVAQELTAARPPADLRARVMDRIGALPASSRFTWHWKLVLVPLAAAAIVFVIARQRPETGTPVLEVARTASVASETSGAGPVNAVASAPTTSDVKQRASRSTDRRIHHASSEELAWRERAISALVPVDALDLKDIQPAPLSIPQLEVKPLGTAADGGSVDRHE